MAAAPDDRRSGVRMVCISDTHGDHARVELPPGDVLIHAGDITAHGSQDDLQSFLDWFSAQPYRYRLFIAGNHDTALETNPAQTLQMAAAAGVTYLNDSGITIDGVRFWGSPITPRFHDWAFMRDPGPDIERHWDLIPADTDVLVTHGPPLGVLDVVERSATEQEHTGCRSLGERVTQLQPRYHVFGHIHEGFGRVVRGQVQYLNVSTMNKHYLIANAPVCADITPRADS